MAILVLSLLVGAAATAAAIESFPSGEFGPHLWPLPTGKFDVSGGGDSVRFMEGRDFQFSCVRCVGLETRRVLEKAFERYREIIFERKFDDLKPASKTKQKQEHGATETAAGGLKKKNRLERLDVNVVETEMAMQTLDTDESYALNCDASSGVACHLEANTAVGALRGLESFSQLVLRVPCGVVRLDGGTQLRAGSRDCLALNASVVIVDKPTFSWRGLMIDTARHFLSTDFIVGTVRAMSFSKLNVLHWHISDDQSFPMASEAEPRLAEYGAFSPSLTYSAEDVRRIVAEARDLGVIVIPEFDVPSHATSWGKGYPSLLTPDCERPTLDPSREFTYDLLGRLFGEMSGGDDPLFPTPILHVGGDEVVKSCWMDSPPIQTWMQKMNFTTFRQVEQYFSDRTAAIAKKMNVTLVHWQEFFDNGVELPKSSIVEVWKTNDIKRVLAAPGDLLVVNSDNWYLNHMCDLQGSGGWEEFWAVNITENLTPAEIKRVLGGESAMWNVCVDSSNFEPTVWPRASAAAERLWSGSIGSGDKNYALERMLANHCRLRARGVRASPIQPGFCPFADPLLR